MGIIRIGANGELTLPPETVEELGLRPGDTVRVDPVGGTLVVRGERAPPVGTAAAASPPSHPQKMYTLEDFIGAGGKFHRPISQEEIDDAIAESAAERFLRR